MPVLVQRPRHIAKFPSSEWTNGDVANPAATAVVTATGLSSSSSLNEVRSSAAASATTTSSMSSSATVNQMNSLSSSSTRASTATFNETLSKRASSSTSSSTATSMQHASTTSSSSSEHKTEGKLMNRSISHGSGLRQGPQMHIPGVPLVEEPPSPPVLALTPVVSGGTVVPVVGVSSVSVPSRFTTTTTAQTQEVTSHQQQVTQASTTSVTTDGFTAEKSQASLQGMTYVKTGDMSYQANTEANAMQEKLETESFSAERKTAVMQEQQQITTGEITQQERRMTAATSMNLNTDTYKSEKTAVAKQEERQTVSSQGLTHEETRTATATSKTTIKGISTATKTSSALFSAEQSTLIANCRELQQKLGSSGLDKLKDLSDASDSSAVEETIQWSCEVVSQCCQTLRLVPDSEAVGILNSMDTFIRNAWAVSTHGRAIASSICDELRNSGGLQYLIDHGLTANTELRFKCACVLEQCLTTENRKYIAENGLVNVVMLAQAECQQIGSFTHKRVGTGILENLFKHSESTCRTVIRRGGLSAIVKDIQYSDLETNRHCASALANLSLYGGPENQKIMIQSQCVAWLFPLVFNPDDTIKYFACLALAALVANKELEAHVSQSDALALVERFVAEHDPAEFAGSTAEYVHGQSESWLARLVPVLQSNAEQARSLAAFHFAMEAGIKKKQGITEIFHKIGAVPALKVVASSPNAIASKYAIQALQLIGEELPHKLSQQVPLWTVQDVSEWLKQINFSEYINKFLTSRVDGDLLLQLTEPMLVQDIGISNGILRMRFMRELCNLKRMADYESCNASPLNLYLKSIDSEFTQYTYGFLKAGVDESVLSALTDEQLCRDCGVVNSIHRQRILRSSQDKIGFGTPEVDDNVDKNLDVFISYRRSNGSQLASLLKVHLQLRHFTVFIDVERLEAGMFDNNLLQSVKKAKHFILVLTPNALDRCKEDVECKDWVHREIVAALQSNCNIIPIFDNFSWPEVEAIPDDMKQVHYFNGVTWIHDYQDACVDKLERFMRGEGRNDNIQNRLAGSAGSLAGNPGRTGVYQRSQSNESKSSLSSDKDVKESNEIC